jgi:hypothetical protein
MTHPNFIILYVEQPLKSAEFYSQLLGSKPVDSSEGFAMFALESGVMLGLWAKHAVQPAAPKIPLGGSGELCFSVADRNTVDTIYAGWRKLNLEIIQKPVDMDFGYTFTAIDPDGHRLRVFTPTEV